MSAFYPGAGTDLSPVILFPEIKTWHYMDSQPQSEYGDTFIMYCPEFLSELDQTMRQCGFKLKEESNHLLTYFSSETDQTIYYETSAVFPNAWDPVRHAGSTLVLCGYDIDSERTMTPPSFFSSYSHIITDNLTCEHEWRNIILPGHTLSMMNYPRDNSYEYWMTEQETPDNIRKFVSVERDIKIKKEKTDTRLD